MNKIFIIGTLVAASILMMTAATSLVGTSVKKSSSELNLQPNRQSRARWQAENVVDVEGGFSSFFMRMKCSSTIYLGRRYKDRSELVKYFPISRTESNLTAERQRTDLSERKKETYEKLAESVDKLRTSIERQEKKKMSFICMVGIGLCLYHNDKLFKIIERGPFNIELKANLRLPSVSGTSFVKFNDKILESKKFREAKKDYEIAHDEFEDEEYIEFFEKFKFDLLGEKFHTVIYKDLRYILDADIYLQKLEN